MKFAFIIMGPFDSEKDRARIRSGQAQLIGVSNIEEARSVAKELLAQSVDCIELCGAFGPEGAKEIIDATENKIPVGYVTHLSCQDSLFEKVFGSHQ